MSPRILLIEDDGDLAGAVRAALGRLDAEVAVCNGPKDALEASARPFQLAIVDVSRSSGAAGLSLVPALRSAAPNAEIILVAGAAVLDAAMEAVRHGVFACVRKPLEPENLVALCERALAQVSLRHERTALAKELARSEALYRGIVDTVDALIVGIDAGHTARIWNRGVASTTGWTAEEAVGRDPCDLLLLPEHRGALRASTAEALRRGTAELEIPIRTRHGDKRFVRWRLAPLEDAPGSLVLAVGTDVTEQLELETRAAEAVAMDAMGRLTAGLAHEIRNPLNSALLQLELIARAARRLSEPEPRAKLEERAQIIKSELSRLSQLLDDFFGLARPSHFALEPTDVGALLEEVRTIQEPVAGDAGITLALEVDPATPFVRGDAAKLKQAFVNLIVNAVDAMRARHAGHVWLKAEPGAEPDRVAITIADDGPGLPAQSPQELFQPFVTTKERGTGLGLPIVKKIVDVHGGTISLEPREGGGTIARVELQAARISVLPGGG
ncbi:MAG: PAS domain S-box protein [Sandaracinaceae bacterium]|nr:PAS domain S-box protein [Sandaracinaceae bacterium]